MGVTLEVALVDANHGARKGLQPNDRGLQIIGASD